MNRDIKFRGKRVDNGEWAYGNYTQRRNDGFIHHYIFDGEYDDTQNIDLSDTGYCYAVGFKDLFIEVIPETVGQFTGLHDRNETPIYENDIVRYKEVIPSNNSIQRQIQGADFVVLDFIGKVVWDSEGCSFDVEGNDESDYRGFGARGDYEVEILGNIHEHSHLLEGK